MKDGGYFGTAEIPWFNGGLFVSDAVMQLVPPEIELLAEAAKLDWSLVEPAIFGTLFERSLDPKKRQQIGAHYTALEDIQAILGPVIFQSLRAEWEAGKERALGHLARREKATTKGTRAKAQTDAVNEVGAVPRAAA